MIPNHKITLKKPPRNEIFISSFICLFLFNSRNGKKDNPISIIFRHSSREHLDSDFKTYI